ncbi:S1 family peptidase [Bacillus badius]|uniref:Serine protease n=1 Tax=Bacillus badius TaxID=1455 RepID=A0ABR5APQ7_BACBA|nr:trypsin-like serine protease [Bacillus badius]KIL74235.1 serine protease precursor [Bacillus badius]KZO00625.1 hypothetical protein A4244_15035 [Bacillus badius]KZR57462.1 hypothetical protein A3781_20095 [Bacillus badius]MED0666937.1 trypsin-like serine protease [Bacillus badius]MED4717288.1 trypsin-like serine protease [Bacillus badius]
MKKVAALTFALSLTFIGLGTTNAYAKQTEEQLAEKQSKLIEKFDKELSKMNLDYESLQDIGGVYFDEDVMTIQIDETPTKGQQVMSKQDQQRLEKLKKISEKIAETSPNEFEVKTVSKSYSELVELQKQIGNQAETMGLDNFVIDLSTKQSKLILRIADLSNEDKQTLHSMYGSDLKIEIDKNTEKEHKSKNEGYKSRKSDWNSQGAGIGIGTSAGSCSTAGVAIKGSNLWVMTAGHCNDGSNNMFYQWGSRFGTTHLDATASDYDFLLVKENGSTLKRYASNGLYGTIGDTSTGYDGQLTGSFFQAEGLRVCKVGITTNRTCGVVDVARRQARFGTGLVTSVVKGDGSALSAEGDSGGAWFTRSQPFRLVGIHQGGNKKLSNDYSSVSYFTPWGEVAEKYGLQLYRSSTPTAMN